MTGAFVRYFCHVTPKPDEGFGDLSFAYFQALEGAGIRVRVIALNMADIGAPGSRWEPYARNLVLPIPKSYINVACGDLSQIQRLLTLGCPNVAIFKGFDNERSVAQNAEILMDYDLVLCQVMPDAEKLMDHCVNAVCAVPHGKDLEVMFRDLV